MLEGGAPLFQLADMTADAPPSQPVDKITDLPQSVDRTADGAPPLVAVAPAGGMGPALDGSDTPVSSPAGPPGYGWVLQGSALGAGKPARQPLGGLAIAAYESSPRRYGDRRPGGPRRLWRQAPTSDAAGDVVSRRTRTADQCETAATGSMPVLEDGLSDSSPELESPSSPILMSNRHGNGDASSAASCSPQLLNTKAPSGCSPPPAAPPTDHRVAPPLTPDHVQAAIQDIRAALRRTCPLPEPTGSCTDGTDPCRPDAAVWVRRSSGYREPSAVLDDSAPALRLSGDAEDGGDTDQETDRLLGQLQGNPSSPPSHLTSRPHIDRDGMQKKGRPKEVMVHEPAVLIEGVLFRARYLGSTQLLCDGQPTKATRLLQAEEAVLRIKVPDGDTQPSTDVDLFISTEKIMVLNTDLKEIVMDHALRTISYIADIGELVVLMARRRPSSELDAQLPANTKMICHVFESDEAQFIAQSIGQAFQVAYVEFLKANGIEDHSFVKEMDYQEVLNSQEIFGEELKMFAKKELQKEVVVPKQKGEMLGVVIVESGWGSLVPTVVIANLAPAGAAARCGLLNIGDQIIAINGISLVGLPLAACQSHVKSARTSSAVKLTVVPCPPVVEVKIRRPDTKYQLGFSVQNGVICSLLRGGIAERGGVRVGHRIIEINSQSVVAVPHDRIVSLLATSVGEIHMKTMPTALFRLLTGQESPMYI